MSNSDNIIYGLVDPITDKVMYVGKSEQGIERPKQHNKPSSLKTKSKKNNWIKSLIKMGLIPKIVIIEDCKFKEILNDKEVYWIAFYRKINKKLTNMTDGGSGGNTGKSYKKWKPLFAMNLVTGDIKRYDYIWQTEISGFSPTKVSAVCKGKRHTHKGHIFWYEGEKPREVNKKTTVSLEITDSKTGQVFVFKRIKDAAKFLNLDPSTISHHLNDGTNNRKYIFKKITKDV